MTNRPLHYRDGGVELHGFLADDGAGRRPGVLVFHDGFGLGEHAKERARRLAAAGYVALAADLFGGGATADNLDTVMAILGQFEGGAHKLRDRALVALRALAELPQVDESRIAAIGFCFGGKTVLELARASAPGIRAVASFHGLLTTDQPARAGEVTAKILALNGAEDPLVPKEQIAAFEDEMRAAGTDWQFVNYGGAKHAFTDPGADRRALPYLGYDAAADRRSWAAMLALLEESLG